MKNLFLILMVFVSGTAFSIVKNYSSKDLKRSLPQSCSDFSGTWEGVCTEGMNQNPSEMKITLSQDKCRSIATGTGTYEIGISVTTTKSLPTEIYTETTYLNWVANGKVLNYTQVFSDLDLQTTHAGSSNISGSFQLDAGRLVVVTDNISLCYLNRI